MSSLTGDEEDYIRDYARRYSDFPHETTGRQFFNEEQFEVYRALGFHMADRILSGKDVVIFRDSRLARFDDNSDAIISEVRDTLLANISASVAEGSPSHVPSGPHPRTGSIAQ
jgi:hypothetical protein